MTYFFYFLTLVLAFQLTRPSRGVTLDEADKYPNASKISTHTPLAGRDNLMFLVLVCFLIFQLTRPSRGVTRAIKAHKMVELQISTHTPLAGRDAISIVRCT